jgi:hypothetical protein
MSQGYVNKKTVDGIVGIDGSNISAFGDIITAKLEPVVQIDFVYGINNQLGETSITTTGVADTSSSRLRLQTGTGAAGAATLQSFLIARYRTGEGMIARFSCVWSSSAADSTQVVGAGTTSDGYFFGYNGTSFGVCRRKSGSDNWVEQTAWNGDKCDGTGASGFNWVKTNGNVMMIRYPFLGYGNITFWVQNSETSLWILCHTIKYTNSSALVQVDNPSLRIFAKVINTGNTSNLIMYMGSGAIFISGERGFFGPQFGVDSLKNSITTEANLINIRNCTTYNGVYNTGLLRLRSLSCATDNGNGLATIRFKTGVTLGGTPVFTPVSGSTADNGVTITSGNGVASYDVAGTGTSGLTIFNVCLARNSNLVYDLTPFNLFILPAQTLSITAFSASSSSIQVALNWQGDM